MRENSIENCLLGGALGDALGLPYEGLNAQRIKRLTHGDIRPCLIGGKGMFSDDTEHAVMTLISLWESAEDPHQFARRLARRLRWWFAAIPAGIGLATAKSSIKLWLGCNPAKSGVWSAGNGPLMRAPIIGARFQDNGDLRTRFLDASTLITHRDPRALEAARVIGSAAASACGGFSIYETLTSIEQFVESAEMRMRLSLIRESLNVQMDVGSFANQFTRKPGFVTGFAPDSAAVALYAWLRCRYDYRATVESVIRAGGDTDTIAFIAGSLAGIDCGQENMPAAWLKGVSDWPINPTFISDLSKGTLHSYPKWPLGLLRNGFFLGIVLTHGFRRLLPPY